MKRFIYTLFFSLLLASTSLFGQSLVCNGQINLSLDTECQIKDLSVDAFLEGDVDYDLYDFQILGLNDVPVTLDNPFDPNFIGNYVGQCLTYEVFLISNGNSCWGTVCLEDKIDPSVDCECETPYLDDGVTPNPDCTFRCFETWDLGLLEIPGRNNEVLPDFPLATDNCGPIFPSSLQLVTLPGSGCGDEIVTRTVLYTYTNFDGSSSSFTCEQNFLFAGLSIATTGSTANGTWDGYANIFAANAGDRALQDVYTPEPIVLLPCGSGVEPADIAAAYDVDTPGRPLGIDRDDYGDTPNIVEHNEGYPYAYPYVVTAGWAGRYHAKPIDNNICNIYSVYTDLEYETCSEECKLSTRKVARTWTILDWCNAETIEFVQTIKVIDLEAPAISGRDVTISVDPWSCEANYLIPPPEHLHDNCDTNPTWSVLGPTGVTIYNGEALALPKGVSNFVYEGVDCCGNTGYGSFTVTVVDATPPTAITKENIVVQLTNTIDGDGQAKLFAADVDNFSHDGGCGPVHLEIRRPIEDWCTPGNNTFNNDGHEFDHPDDTDGGEFVKFCCEDAIDIDDDGTIYGIHDVILRVWDDGDMDGTYGSAGDNYNESWATIRVEDKLDPIVVCPPHIELACEEDYLDYDLTGRPYASKTCSDVDCEDDPSDNFQTKPTNSAPFVGEEIPAYNPTCRRGAIRRTWNCGGKTCTQWIIMRDTDNDPLIVDFPGDKTSECVAEDAGEPDVVERICELVGTSLESDTFYFEDGSCFKILNHWTVINWCDYDAADPDLNDQIEPEDDGFVPGYLTHTQTIKVIDTEKPVITAIDTCYAVNADCYSEDVWLKASATDNGDCASEWLKWTVEVDAWSDWEVDYTYSSFLPADDDYYVAPTGGGQGVHIALPDGIPSACGLQHRVLWRVEDGCNNTSSFTTYFTIEDKKKPTPYMLNLSTALMQSGGVELWASDFDAGSFDNCTDQDYLLYTFSSTVPAQLLNPSLDPWYDADGEASESDYEDGDAELWDGDARTSARVFDEDDLAAAEANDGLLPVEIYVWDECGNYDYAVVNLKLIQNAPQGNRAMIAGKVKTESGAVIDGINMTIISDQPAYPATTSIYADGLYLFEDNLMDEDYAVSGEKNDDWLNGVTTLDLVMIQRHILGIADLNSPYKMIAADANNNGGVSAVDLVELRKLILGIYLELPNNDSWRFVETNQSMNMENPWPFSEIINIQALEHDMVNEDFVAVKIGDVNDSIEEGFNADSTSDRSNNTIGFNIEKSASVAGVSTYTFNSSDFDSVNGFQFTLHANVEEIIDVQSNLIEVSDANFSIRNGALLMSWNTSKAADHIEGTLFSITMKASEVVGLSNEVLTSEAYVGSSLEIRPVVLGASDAEITNFLGQNEPNPFKDFTTIRFSFANAGQATFSVFDVAGRVLYTETNNYSAGVHSISLNNKDLNASSNVLYYKLQSEEFNSTKKMIVIE